MRGIDVEVRSAEPQTNRLAYSPGLDGVRAVACLAVMLYHADFLHVTGGFLGVTIFFTLSGFLITSVLLDELRVENHIDLRDFWRRRVFRIMPLLLFVSATWALWGAAAGSDLGRQTITGALSTIALVTNWITTRNELAAGLLNGNWSVILEEQFYIVWPLLLLLLYRRLPSERNVARVVVVLAVGIAAHRWLIAPDWTRIWYATDTHADALLAGCAVALGMRCRSRTVSLSAGIVLVALLFVARPADLVTIRLVMPAAALCTALVIPYLQVHRTILGCRGLAAVGRRSYSLYLWGGPILYLAKHVFLVDALGMALAIGVTFAVAELSYRAIEVPMRRFRRRPVLPGYRPYPRARIAARNCPV